jgi:hypothetical protein
MLNENRPFISETNGSELEQVKEILDGMRARLDGHGELLRNLEDALIAQVFLENRHADPQIASG